MGGRILDYCSNRLDKWQNRALKKQLDEATERTRQVSAWRIEGTLREFPKFPPINTWFRYPVHVADESRCLQDIQPEEDAVSSRRYPKGKKASKEDPATKKRNEFEIAFNNLELSGEPVLLRDLSKALGYSNDDTLKKKLREGGEFSDGFEKYIGTNSKCYVKRRNAGNDNEENE